MRINYLKILKINYFKASFALNYKFYKYIDFYKFKKEKPRTPGIPKRSPIQVLTGLDVA